MRREQLIARLIDGFHRHDQFRRSLIYIYGSSNNGFGTEGSDVDLCFVDPLHYLHSRGNAASRDRQLAPPRANPGHSLRGSHLPAPVRPLLQQHPPHPQHAPPQNLLLHRSARPHSRAHHQKMGEDQLHQQPRAQDAQLLRIHPHAHPLPAERRQPAPPPHPPSFFFFPAPHPQELPPDWDGGPVPRNTRRPQIPIKSYQQSVYDTYFYCPKHLDLLCRYAKQNTMTVGELLLKFFYFYAFEFDYYHAVVSVRQRGFLDREEKCWRCLWKMQMQLCIEDPFEDDYDVAHVITPHTSQIILQCFAKTYSVLLEKQNELNDYSSADLIDEIFNLQQY
ncbi:uncharacterized protein [Blastocystis hominis]|uniref:Uncharacterized protein n=1 Tax=Blastocystis hominis TaxID=12968 RepID=D8LWJ6_BLAHO|nr:uncharacterized protein [Blastocystis hominis]CBK20185.2 unnamed protein product [Blastocystis hominis]|eukprot:XP_012894233.1 uncharacterized protein [Blastocystis hominis]